jgi:outer membrane protein OmpA-like peptidoglycan-associated protein
MRYRFALLVFLAFINACGGQIGRSYSIIFQPYSADLDPQAQKAVQAAAIFANAHPLMPISIVNFTPYNGFNGDTMSGQRADAVLNALLKKGVSRMRIEIKGTDRLLDPNGMPNLPTPRVDIHVGL